MQNKIKSCYSFLFRQIYCWSIFLIEKKEDKKMDEENKKKVPRSLLMTKLCRRLSRRKCWSESEIKFNPKYIFTVFCLEVMSD